MHIQAAPNKWTYIDRVNNIILNLMVLVNETKYESNEKNIV